MEGFTEFPITKLDTAIPRTAPEKVPVGNAIEARNVRYRGEVIRMRPAMRRTFAAIGEDARVTGLGQFITQTAERVNLLYTSSGSLQREVTNGSESTQQVPYSGVADTYAQFANAYGRMYITFSTLASPSAAPKQYYTDGLAFYLDDIGLTPNAIAPSGGISNGLGNIQIGTRWVVVLGKTRTGYIGGATIDAAREVTITSPDQQLLVTDLPIFADTNVIERVIAVTPVNGSTAGPWFYIAVDEEVDGVVNKSTIVPDNTATSYLLDFTDEFLSGLEDITDRIFDVEKLGSQTSLFYSKNLKRMFAWGDNDSIARVSEIDDPEVFRTSQGFIQVGATDGEKIVGVVDFKTETLILKTESGYPIGSTANPPNQWAVPQRWVGIGPLGPRAYDSDETMVVIASRGGLYIYTGDMPQFVSDIWEPIWKRINWDVGHLVWVMIDHSRQEIRVGVPLDQSTLPNKVFTIDTSRGGFYGYRGDYLARWSTDDIWAHSALEVVRDLPAPSNPQDVTSNDLKNKQILFASSASDGVVNIQDPSSHSDNGVAIDEFYQLAYASLKGVAGINKLGGVDVSALGAGRLVTRVQPRITERRTQPDPITVDAVRPINLTAELSTSHRNLDRDAEKFSVSVSNGNDPSAWFELQGVALWLKPVQSAQQ